MPDRLPWPLAVVIIVVVCPLAGVGLAAITGSIIAILRGVTW